VLRRYNQLRAPDLNLRGARPTKTPPEGGVLVALLLSRSVLLIRYLAFTLSCGVALGVARGRRSSKDLFSRHSRYAFDPSTAH
jgi:hypothetical protein